MECLIKYAERQNWLRRGEGFSIEVVRWESGKGFYERPQNHWNYYCYIYPNHPLFEKLVDEEMQGGSIIDNLHNGCTYCEWNRNKEGKVTCKKYGCDYEHIWDDYEEMHKLITPDDAYMVFNDAERLFDELSQTKNEGDGE